MKRLLTFILLVCFTPVGFAHSDEAFEFQCRIGLSAACATLGAYYLQDNLAKAGQWFELGCTQGDKGNCAAKECAASACTSASDLARFNELCSARESYAACLIKARISARGAKNSGASRKEQQAKELGEARQGCEKLDPYACTMYYGMTGKNKISPEESAWVVKSMCPGLPLYCASLMKDRSPVAKLAELHKEAVCKELNATCPNPPAHVKDVLQFYKGMCGGLLRDVCKTKK